MAVAVFDQPFSWQWRLPTRGLLRYRSRRPPGLGFRVEGEVEIAVLGGGQNPPMRGVSTRRLAASSWVCKTALATRIEGVVDPLVPELAREGRALTKSKDLV